MVIGKRDKNQEMLEALTVDMIVINLIVEMTLNGVEWRKDACI